MPRYREERISLMEPLLIRQGVPLRGQLMEMAFTVAMRSSGFCRSLPAGVAADIAETVRGMNCYYSNLIEGHNTHPIAIERALGGDYSHEPKKRNLQHEALAHIHVQRWLDSVIAKNRETTVEIVREIHRRFCEHLPAELLCIEDPKTGEIHTVVPGEFRKTHVQVGEHIPVAPAQIVEFLERYEAVYSPLHDAEAILHAAASHHRLLWIHPFLDGNGRVARLVSHALLTQRTNSGALWSISRGLARNVEQYKSLLHNADRQRHGDTDGRGNLSEHALVEFTRFFLEMCLDQIDFMESLLRPAELRARILVWAKEEIAAKRLPERSIRIFEALLYKGELHRGEIQEILGVTYRYALKIISELEAVGAIGAASSREPYRLKFPYKISLRWLPGLYPPLPDA